AFRSIFTCSRLYVCDSLTTIIWYLFFPAGIFTCSHGLSTIKFLVTAYPKAVFKIGLAIFGIEEYFSDSSFSNFLTCPLFTLSRFMFPILGLICLKIQFL